MFNWLKKRFFSLGNTTVTWCILLSASSVFVQQGPEEFIKQYKIAFPIAELGNCTDYTSCRTYCEDPLNYAACSQYAKAKGFSKGEQETEKLRIVTTASKELGCSSHETCKTLCERVENFERCNSFAQKYRLAGGYVSDPTHTQIIEKAKAVLGCASYETCKSYCEQDINAKRCTEFARRTGIRGGQELKGPGGCTSETTCKAFCSIPENFRECERFAETVSKSSNQEEHTFKGPGGCDSENACRDYCEKNPYECGTRYFAPNQPIPTYAAPKTHDDYEKFCRDNPSHCTYEKYCVFFPDKCKMFMPSIYPHATPAITPYSTIAVTPRQESDGTFCLDSDGSNYYYRGSCQDKNGTYADFCDGSTVRDYYCTGTWNGSSWNNYHCALGGFVCSSAGATCSSGACLSSTSSSDGSSTTSTPPSPTPSSSSSSCWGGRYWNGSSCVCPSGQTWNGSSCTSSCSEPSGGCGSSYYWDSGSCQCRPNPTSSPCQQPSSGCPSNYYWNSASCECRPNPTSSPCQPPSSGCGTDHYWNSSTCSCQSSSWQYQQTQCQNTSGCTWTGSTCNCSGVQGVTTHNLTFPIAELGNCNTCGECSAYCQRKENRETCIAFSKTKGFFEEEQEEQKKIFEKAKITLGCTSEESCRTLCQQEENFEECTLFAAKNDIVDTPVITNPEANTTITKKQVIGINATPLASVDFFLQPIDSITDSLFIGHLTLASENGAFSWDPSYSPNGRYNLIATVTSNGQTTTTPSVTVTIDNQPPVSGEVPITTKDIVFPSQFNPDTIPSDSATSVETISNTTTTDNTPGVMLQGKGPPNTIVSLLIYSNPIVVTVRTDANGQWTYTLDKPLDAGEHTAYVVVAKPDGTRIRSQASSFVVPQAFAASNNTNNKALTLESANQTGPLQRIGFITAILTITALGILLVLYTIKAKKPS